MDKAQQAVINGQFVVKVPITNDAAMFFVKQNNSLQVYAYRWINDIPGSEQFTGRIVSINMQTYLQYKLQYKDGKLIKARTFINADVATSGSKSKTVRTDGLFHFIGQLLQQIGCLLTGGTWTTPDTFNIAEGNGDCQGRWTLIIGDSGGGVSGEGATTGDDPSNPFGNTSAAIAGAGTGTYVYVDPSFINGAFYNSYYSPSFGTPYWVFTPPAPGSGPCGAGYEDQTVKTKKTNEVPPAPAPGSGGNNNSGCGTWTPYTVRWENMDTYTGDETDKTDDDAGVYSGPTEHIPSTITLSNGETVSVIFGTTSSDHLNADNAVSVDLVNALIYALNVASQNVQIKSIYINCTTNGQHINNPPNHVSNHYRGLAIDLSRVNGIPVAASPNSDLFKYIQIGLDQYSNIRENFGPYFKHRFGTTFNTKDGSDHIHFSVNP